MNWDAIGSIGEITCATAVLATLVYLAIQTRQSNLLARSSALLEIHHQIVNFRNSVAYDPDLARITMKVENDVGEDLTELDLFRLSVRLQASMRLFEGIFLQYQTGVLRTEDFNQFKPLMMRLHKAAMKYDAWKVDTESAIEFRDYLEVGADT